MFSLSGITIDYQGKNIVSDFSLRLPAGKIHALMGPNGSGKSTLSLALAGHPQYVLHPRAKINLNGQNLTPLSPDQRAKAGLFLSFQSPVSIPGLTVKQVLKTMVDHLHQPKISLSQYLADLNKFASLIGLKPEFLDRNLNEGFSGGEKKRLEMLTLLLARPQIAILDEIDSGLDIDALKMIAQAITYAQTEFQTGFIIVTHYRRILEYLTLDKVHILSKGKLVLSDGPQLIDRIEAKGYRGLV